MGFFSSLFGGGGPTPQQEALAGQAASMSAVYNQAFQSQLAGLTDVQNKLSSYLTPIANLGPNAQGFSAPELAAMNTQAINEAGAAARNAAMVTGTTLAGRGGGASSGIVSGIEAGIKGSEASAAASQLAAAQEAITQKNYDVGRQNFWNATAGEQALAGTFNPAAIGKVGVTAEQTALTAADQIQKEKQAAKAGPLGLLDTGLGFLTGGLSNLDTAGTSTTGEQAKNFFTGGFNALAGQ